MARQETNTPLDRRKRIGIEGKRDGGEAKRSPLTRPKMVLKGLRAGLTTCCVPLTGRSRRGRLGQRGKPAAAGVTCYRAAAAAR